MLAGELTIDKEEGIMDHKFRGTYLTDRQWAVVRCRSEGLTQYEVARRLRTSRENVSILEHRSWLKIKEARATLAALEEMTPAYQVTFPSGTSIYDALSMIISRADILSVKLRNSSDDILAALRSKFKGKIRGHHFVSTVKTTIKNDGTLFFESEF
jgi:HTH-type transcriptional regulator, fmd operon transcriptional regulator